MTKEEIIWKNCGVTGKIVETHISKVEKAMDEFAKQQAIAFFKWNASKVSEYMDYLRRTDQAQGVTEIELELNHFEGTTIDGRYAQFIEQQNKDK